MACKKNVKYSLKQGKEEYLMLTCDFGSLQMRLTTQDTVLDSKDQKTPDAGLFEIYGEGSPCADAHSSTGRNVFVSSVGGQEFTMTLEDGSDLSLYQEMSVHIKRDGKDLTVKVKDLQVDDDIQYVLDEKTSKHVPDVDYEF